MFIYPYSDRLPVDGVTKCLLSLWWSIDFYVSETLAINRLIIWLGVYGKVVQYNSLDIRNMHHTFKVVIVITRHYSEDKTGTMAS